MAEGSLERLLVTWFRVPARPEPPSGSPGSLRVFNAAPGFYRYRVAAWTVKQVGTAIGLVFGLAALRTVDLDVPLVGRGIIDLIELMGVVSFLVQLPVTYMMIGLDFRYRWYMVTDTSLRIREGLLRIREQTMTYANIQNLTIQQGPVQRLFSISDLMVRTAGGGTQAGKSDHEGSGTDNMHLAYFRGVDNAAEIRDLVLNRMRKLRDSGLGDPDEVSGGPHSGDAPAVDERADLLTAARELLVEARRLRSALE